MIFSNPPPAPVTQVRVNLDTPEVRAAEADLARARAATLAQADAAIAAAEAVVQAAQGVLLAGSSLRNLLSSSRKFKLPPRDTRPSFSRPESLEHPDDDTRPAGYCIKDK